MLQIFLLLNDKLKFKILVRKEMFIKAYTKILLHILKDSSGGYFVRLGHKQIVPHPTIFKPVNKSRD